MNQVSWTGYCKNRYFRRIESDGLLAQFQQLEEITFTHAAGRIRRSIKTIKHIPS